MKVITLIQPWATLIALGEKKFETRSWQTKFRGELGIHAGNKIDKEACRREPIRSVLAKHGYDETNLPTGVIIATVRLTDCFQVAYDSGKAAILGDGSHVVWQSEYAFGNYAVGRYAWWLTDVKQLPDPIPAKGQLSLWNWEG